MTIENLLNRNGIKFTVCDRDINGNAYSWKGTTKNGEQWYLSEICNTARCVMIRIGDYTASKILIKNAITKIKEN